MHLEHLRLLLMQVAAAPVPIPGTADTTSTASTGGAVMLIAAFVSQVKVNGIVAVVIQMLKNWETPVLSWIDHNTPWMTRAVAALAAAATAVGIHWTFGGGTLMITGLGLTSILTLLYNTAQNFMFQHAWFKTIFAKPAGPPAPAPVQPAAS